MAEEGSDMVVLPSGQCVQNAFVEEIARELVPALDQVAVLHTARRDSLVALVTLRLSEDLAGRLLGDDALALARKHGSTANTLITARSCCIFRRGLQASFSNVNLALAAAGLPDAQIQRCHILLNGFCKEDNTLRASGTLNRSQIARKHANLMHTLAPVSSGDTVPAGTVVIATDKNAVRKGPKKYNVMTHARWLERKAGDQQPLVTKRGWNLTRGISESTKMTRKDKLPESAAPDIPNIEDRIQKYKAKREQADSCNSSVCNSEAEDSALDECPLSTSLDISSQRSRLRRRGGVGAGAERKTDSEDDSEPSLAQMLAMTKSKLSAVSDRQRQSAGEGSVQEEEERQRLAKEEEEARVREAARKQEEELAAAAAQPAQAAQESEACKQQEQAAVVAKAAQEEEERLRLANEEEEERAREEAGKQEEQAEGGGGPMETEQSIFHGPSAGMENKEDKEKALMGGCDQGEKQAVVIVAKQGTEGVDVAEMEEELVENVSQAPAHSALEPRLFVSPLPSREAPPSSASFTNLSVHAAAGRGGKAMWCGGGGGNAMYSMTPGKGRCEIEGQRDREPCLDAAEGRSGEAKEMSSMLSLDTEGARGGGLSPTTVAFWQRSQVSAPSQPALQISAPRSAPTTPREQDAIGASSSRSNTPLASPRVLEVTKYDPSARVSHSISTSMDEGEDEGNPRENWEEAVARAQRPGIYSTASSSISCSSTCSSASSASSASSTSVTEVFKVPPSPGASQSHGAKKVGLIRVKVVSASTAHKDEEEEVLDTLSKQTQAHKISFSRRSQARGGGSEGRNEEQASGSKQGLQTTREKQQLLPKVPTITFSDPAWPMHEETGEGARGQHGANNTHITWFSRPSQIGSGVLSTYETSSPAPAVQGAITGRDTEFPVLDKLADLKKADAEAVELEKTLACPEQSNSMSSIADAPSGGKRVGSTVEGGEGQVQVRELSHEAVSEPKRHTISFSRRSGSSYVTNSKANTIATTTVAPTPQTNGSTTTAGVTATATNAATADTTADTTCTPVYSGATTAMLANNEVGKGRKWDKTIVPAGKRVISLEGLQVFSPMANSSVALSHHIDLQITSPPQAPKFQISSITSPIVSPLSNKSGENIMAFTLLRTSPSNAPAAQSESPWKAPKPLLPSVEDCLEQPPPQSPPLPHKLPNSSLLAQDHKQSQDTWQDTHRGQKRERSAMMKESANQEEKNTSPPQNRGADSSKKKMRMVKEGELRERMFQQAFVVENSHRQQSPPSSIRKMWNSVSKNRHAPSSSSRDAGKDKYSHNAVWEKLMKASPACEISEGGGDEGGPVEIVSCETAGARGGGCGGSAAKGRGGASGSGRKGGTQQGWGRAFGMFLCDNVLRSRTPSQDERKRRSMSGENPDSSGHTPSSGKKRRSSFGGIFDCMLKDGTFSPKQPGTPRSRAGSGGGTSGKKQKATSTSKQMEKAARAADARRDLENVRFRL